MRTTFWLSFALASAGAAIACVGDDPVLSAPPTDRDAAVGSSSSSSGAADAGPNEIPGEYGVFLTRQLYPTNFAKTMRAASVRAFVDQECQQAATVAGLRHADRYHAIITTVQDAADRTDLTDLQRYASVERGAWCSIDRDRKLPNCATPSAVIFERPADLSSGPRQTLDLDETGAELPVDARYTIFYSGMFSSADENMPAIRNCTGWTVREPFGGDSGVLDGGGEAMHGYGSTAAAQYAKPFQWAAGGAQFCGDSQALPLLCLQAPAELL